ncbi:WD40-repeat-containing domain protein, partial [Pavlovales sp. CCMP2436]
MDGTATALLTSCPAKRELHVWDPLSGLVLRTYKDCAAPPRGLAVVDAGHFVAAQVGRPQLHIYSWAREQPTFRCQTPEELRALVCTSDGTYCIGAGCSGRLYLWAIRSGSLLLAWDAHFKSSTALALTADDSVLISGGADALVTVWSLADALACADPSSARGASPTPLWTWSSHALAVTDVAVGRTCPGSLALSASLDGTVHVRELARGELLHVLRAPAPVHSVCLSPCEHSVFAGTAAGLVHEATLHGAAGVDLGRAGGRAGAPFASHAAVVHGVRAVGAGGTLVTCGADGTVRSWDVRSRQQLSVLSSPQ